MFNFFIDAFLWFTTGWIRLVTTYTSRCTPARQESNPKSLFEFLPTSNSPWYISSTVSLYPEVKQSYSSWDTIAVFPTWGEEAVYSLPVRLRDSDNEKLSNCHIVKLSNCQIVNCAFMTGLFQYPKGVKIRK